MAVACGFCTWFASPPMYRDGFWTVSRTDSILRSRAACVMERMLADGPREPGRGRGRRRRSDANSRPPRGARRARVRVPGRTRRGVHRRPDSGSPRLAAQPLRGGPELRQVGGRPTGEVLVCRPAQGAGTAVGDAALERPAGDGHEVEQLARDGPHSEAGPENADQLDRPVRGQLDPVTHADLEH